MKKKIENQIPSLTEPKSKEEKENMINNKYL